MRTDLIFTVLRKELVDSLRDRRTIFMMIFLPIILYPLLFIFITQIQSAGLARLKSQPSRISARGRIPEDLYRLIQKDTTLIYTAIPDPGTALARREVEAYLEWRPDADSVIIYYDGAKERSQLANSRLKDLLQSYKTELQKRAMLRYNLASNVLEPFGLRAENTAPPSRMGSLVLGFILPILLVVSIMLGAMYPAMDLTAGEKERGTMETILTLPVDKRELFLGKFLAVVAISLATGVLNLISIMMTFSAGLIQLGAAAGKIDFSINPVSLILIFLSLLPLSFFISAILISASLFARSYKDAQNIVTPIYLLLFLPTQIALMPGIQLNRLSALIPVTNITLLFKDILLGEYSWGLLLLVFLINLLLAFMAVMLSAGLFGSEEVLLGSGRGLQISWRRSKAPATALTPAAALTLYVAVLLLLFYIGGFVQIKFHHWGLLATLWLLILAPALALAWYFRLDFGEAFHLKPFGWRHLFGTILLCLGAAGLASWVDSLQSRLFPESLKLLQGLRDYLDLQKTGLLPGLLILAVSPGICEEMLFRGLLLSSFHRRLSARASIILTSALFAIIHLNIFRLLPTFLLGLYLTFIVHRTRSIYLAMMAHALNNGLALVIINTPWLTSHYPWLAGQGLFPYTLLLVLAALAGLGVWLIMLDDGKSVNLR